MPYVKYDLPLFYVLDNIYNLQMRGVLIEEYNLFRLLWRPVDGCWHTAWRHIFLFCYVL